MTPIQPINDIADLTALDFEDELLGTEDDISEWEAGHNEFEKLRTYEMLVMGV